MESIIKSVSKNRPLTIAIIVLAIVAFAYTSILGMNPEEQEELLYLLQDFLPIIMFASLAMLLFSGFPVAFILGGLALLFGLFGYFLDVFSLIEFFNFENILLESRNDSLLLIANCNNDSHAMMFRYDWSAKYAQL